MRLSSDAIIEFQALHKRIFGKRPSDDEADQDLIMLMRIVSLTQPDEEYWEVQNDYENEQN